MPSLPTTPARIFVPPTSTPITLGIHGRRLPYRRARPEASPTDTSARPPLGLPFAAGCRRRRSPTASTEEAGSRARSRRPGRAPGLPPARINLRPTRRWLRWIPALIGAFLLLVVVWGAVSYFQFRDGVSAANKRLERARRADARRAARQRHQHPPARDHHAQLSGRESANRSDSITLVRVDTSRHRIAYLSIPRDLVVEIPGTGLQDQRGDAVGGPRLAVLTVKKLTGLPVNHVAVVDFSQFEDLIDKLGGIDIRSPSRSSPSSTAPMRQRSGAPAGPAGGSPRGSSTWTATAR